MTCHNSYDSYHGLALPWPGFTSLMDPSMGYLAGLISSPQADERTWDNTLNKGCPLTMRTSSPNRALSVLQAQPFRKPAPSNVSFPNGGAGDTSILPHYVRFICQNRIRISSSTVYAHKRHSAHLVYTEAAPQALLSIISIRPPYAWHQAPFRLLGSCS